MPRRNVFRRQRAVIFIDEHYARLQLPRLSLVALTIRDDNNDVIDLPAMRGGAVQTHHSAAALAFNRIGHQTLPIGHIDDMNLLEQDIGTASNIVVTPGYNGTAPFGSASGTDIHYFPVADAGGTISNDDSQNDYALIHLDHAFSDTGSFGLSPDFAGGTVDVTGYPASAGGALITSVQTVSRDPDYTLLDGTPLGPGSSGGPVWTSDAAGNSYVVGVVSSESFDRTVGYSALITTDALHTISAWIASDEGTPAPQPGVVCDNAADVASELPQLGTAAQAGALVSITLTDPGLATLPISLDRLFGGQDALRFITESFAVDVSPDGARGNVPDVQARALGAGTSIKDVRFADGQMVYDPTAPAAQVVRLYQAALGRAPDQPGLHGWVNAIKTGTPLAAVANGFIGSREFQQRFGADPTDGAFVDQLYGNVLHRAPDAGGYALWTRALAGGMTRGQALTAFSEGTENKLGTAPVVQAGIWDLDENAPQVARLYDTVFGRSPDAGGLRTWDDALDARALSLDQVAAQFMQSPEFLGRYGSPSNPAFVDALYANTLHRAPDANGSALWTGALDSGALSRAGAVVGFSESQEHQNSTAANIYGGDPGSFGVRLA